MAYTFKDDGSAMTYFREYNKEVGTGDKTLVGNWVEERALRDDIKTGRYMLWANPDPDPKAAQKTFTKFTTRPDALETYRRTVFHSDVSPRPNRRFPSRGRQGAESGGFLFALHAPRAETASAEASAVGSGARLLTLDDRARMSHPLALAILRLPAAPSLSHDLHARSTCRRRRSQRRTR